MVPWGGGCSFGLSGDKTVNTPPKTPVSPPQSQSFPILLSVLAFSSPPSVSPLHPLLSIARSPEPIFIKHLIISPTKCTESEPQTGESVTFLCIG